MGGGSEWQEGQRRKGRTEYRQLVGASNGTASNQKTAKPRNGPLTGFLDPLPLDQKKGQLP